jgi:hypothetical protein
MMRSSPPSGGSGEWWRGSAVPRRTLATPFATPSHPFAAHRRPSPPLAALRRPSPPFAGPRRLSSAGLAPACRGGARGSTGIELRRRVVVCRTHCSARRVRECRGCIANTYCGGGPNLVHARREAEAAWYFLRRGFIIFVHIGTLVAALGRALDKTFLSGGRRPVHGNVVHMPHTVHSVI